MTETTGAQPATKEVAQKSVGHRLQKGHHIGRPKGSRDRRAVAGQMAATALEAKAWSVVAALLECRSWRARLESAKVVLSYAIGLPKQTLTIAGGIGDLGRELAAALQAARERRAALDAVVPVQAILAAPLAIVAGAEIAVDVPVNVPVDAPVPEAEK